MEIVGEIEEVEGMKLDFERRNKRLFPALPASCSKIIACLLSPLVLLSRLLLVCFFLISKHNPKQGKDRSVNENVDTAAASPRYL